MRKIEVHIEVVSETLSLDQITQLLGLRPSSWSHSIGDKRSGLKRMGKWGQTYWKTEEINVNSLSYNEVLRGFKASGISPESICGLARVHGLQTNIVAGCFTDAGNLSLGIDNSSMVAFSNLGVNLDIAFYACSEMS